MLFDGDRDKMLSSSELTTLISFSTRHDITPTLKSLTATAALICGDAGKITEPQFTEWAKKNAHILRFFDIFRLLPDPLLEREVLADILARDKLRETLVRETLAKSKKSLKEHAINHKSQEEEH